MALLLEIESSIGYSVIFHALLHFNLWNTHDLTHLLASIRVEFLQINPSNQVGVRAQLHPLLLESRQLPAISSFKESKHHQEEPQVWMFFFIFIHLSKFKKFLHSWVRARFGLKWTFIHQTLGPCWLSHLQFAALFHFLLQPFLLLFRCPLLPSFFTFCSPLLASFFTFCSPLLALIYSLVYLFLQPLFGP